MPGLKRIVLIDTHLSGRVELKLDGHTNICGTNASGKTTLQRLIPVFYGESPSRVVPSTRDSFERWYLPRDSSFIIYEYEQHEGNICQLVLSSNGTGVQYRLVGKPFEMEDYLFETGPGEFTPLTSKEMYRHFKRLHVMVTSQLNTKQFRGVLQNDRTLINTCTDSRELMGYARMFSLCASGQHMRHIEKLAKAVHSKEGKMETIKAMIGAILEEDGVQPPASSLKPSQVETWIKECQLIQEFDAIRPEFGKLQETEQQLQQTETRLSSIKIQIDQDLAILAASLVKLQDTLEGLIAEKKVADAQWHKTQDELNQQLSEARADCDKYEKDLERIEDEYESWQDQDIDTLTQNVQKLPQWLDEQQTLAGRYELLTEKHQDIEAAFNRRMADVKERLAEQLDELGQARQHETENKSRIKSEQQLSLQKIQSEAQQEKHGLQQEYSSQRSDLKVQEAEAKARLQSAGYSEFEQTQLELQDASIKEASQLEDQSREAVQHSNKELVVAKSLRHEISDELNALRKKYQDQELEIKRIESLLYPGNNELLEYLRAEMPEWQNNLGKVIKPELLKRKDLKPHFDEANNSLFGLQLDLSVLDLPEYAKSETELQQELEIAQEKLGQLSEQQSEIELRLSKASESVRKLELEIANLQAKLNTAEASRKRAQQDKAQLLSEYQQALSDRKQSNRKALEKVQQKLQKLLAQQELALEELEERLSQQEMEQKFHWEQLLNASEEKLLQLKQQIDSAKRQAKEDETACEQYLADEMAKRGVDVDEIGNLKKQLEKLKKDISHTETNRHKVQDYQRWLKNVFNGEKLQRQQQLSQSKKELAEADRQLKLEQQDYQQKRQNRNEKQTQTEQSLTSQKDQQEQASRIFKALQKLLLPKVEDAEALGMAGNVSQRISEGDELLQARSQLSDVVRNKVEQFDHLIAAQSGTGLSDIWEHAREECTYQTANKDDSIGVQLDYRKLVSHLDQLLNEVVPQKLNGLKQNGRIFGADISNYFAVLKDIDKRIVGQSKRITHEVGEELFLDGVSDSAVRIRSKITELEFWPELLHFNQLYEDWIGSGEDQLPGDDYGACLRRVLDILGRANLTGGISRLLDIELRLKEGNSDLVIRTDRQLNESSSHGMAYLILCKFLLAFTRLLRGHAEAVVHWPIDELGTLHQNNIQKIFDACENNNIHVLGAFPNPDSDILNLFSNRYIVDKAKKKLQVVQPKVSAITEKLKERALSAGERKAPPSAGEKKGARNALMDIPDAAVEGNVQSQEQTGQSQEETSL